MTVNSRNQDWLEKVLSRSSSRSFPFVIRTTTSGISRRGAVRERYLLDEMLADLSGGHNVVSTVFIECGAMFKADGPEAYRCIGETEFVNGIAAMSASGSYGKTRIAAGIIGTVDLRIGDAAAGVLDAHVAAGGGRFRGIRRGAFWHSSPEIEKIIGLTRPRDYSFKTDFRAGFKHLAARKLSFEVWCAHPQIPDATSLARAFPDTTIVLDHFGGPIGAGPYVGKQDEVFADWKTQIDELARCPNVVAKLGGLNMEVNGYGWERRPAPPTSSKLMQATRRYFEHTIDRFGVDRCMFEVRFRSTSLAAVTPCFGTHSSSSRKTTPQLNAQRYFTTPQRAYIGYDERCRDAREQM